MRCYVDIATAKPQTAQSTLIDVCSLTVIISTIKNIFITYARKSRYSYFFQNYFYIPAKENILTFIWFSNRSQEIITNR